MGTHGGARCPGDIHHPWTRRPNAAPMTCDARGRLLRGAPGTASVVRLVTSGATAISPSIHQVWRIARANRPPAPIRCLSPSSRPCQHHPSGGAKKLLATLQKRHPRGLLPARSTVGDIFSRHGWVPKRRHSRHLGHPGKPTRQRLAPYAVWSADFKGHVHTGDGLYGSPLTVADGDSRCLLGCQALAATRGARPRQASPACAKSSVGPSASARTTGCPLLRGGRHGPGTGGLDVGHRHTGVGDRAAWFGHARLG